MPYSSFFRRAVALIIDMLIVSLPDKISAVINKTPITGPKASRKK